MRRRAGGQYDGLRKHQGRTSRKGQRLSRHLASCLRHVGRSLRPVDSIGVVFIQVVNAVLQLVAAMALINAEDKEADVGIQRELVHGVDAAHVIEHEEQD